jgi:hypothetical protein
MKRMIGCSVLGCAFLLASLGCSGGGSNVKDPPSNFKIAPMTGEHKKTNAAKGEEPKENLPSGFGGGKPKDDK